MEQGQLPVFLDAYMSHDVGQWKKASGQGTEARAGKAPWLVLTMQNLLSSALPFQLIDNLSLTLTDILCLLLNPQCAKSIFI